MAVCEHSHRCCSSSTLTDANALKMSRLWTDLALSRKYICQAKLVYSKDVQMRVEILSLICKHYNQKSDD